MQEVHLLNLTEGKKEARRELSVNHLFIDNDAAIIQALLIIILFCACIQGHNRRPVALIFALFIMVHSLFFSGSQGEDHFMTAAFADLLIVLCTANVKRPTWLAVDIHGISLFSVMLNFFGWIAISMDGVNGVFYTEVYSSLLMGYSMMYVYSIYALLKGERNGSPSFNNWSSVFRMRSYYSYYQYFKLSGAAKV